MKLDRPEPSGQSDYKDPESKPQSASLFAGMHRLIIRHYPYRIKAN